MAAARQQASVSVRRQPRRSRSWAIGCGASRSSSIPPAWRDVWISPSPSAKLQATGVDAAGRRQYLYHPEYRAAREREKYDRLVRFGELLPDLRRTLDRHLALGPYEREWACAVAVTLVNRAWFRVGSERHLRASRTYGITTLSKRHVTVRGRRVGFRFRGKHRIAVRTTVVDPEIADAVRELLRYDGGARLLRFDRDGTPANLTAALLNEYIARAPRRGIHGEGLPHLGRHARRQRAASPTAGLPRRRATSGGSSPP